VAGWRGFQAVRQWLNTSCCYPSSTSSAHLSRGLRLLRRCHAHICFPWNSVVVMLLARRLCLSAQNIRRELAEKRFTAELNVEASWRFLNDVGCDATQIHVDCSEDGKVTGDVRLFGNVKTGPKCKPRLLQRRHSNHYWNVRRSRRQTFQPCSNKR